MVFRSFSDHVRSFCFFLNVLALLSLLLGPATRAFGPGAGSLAATLLPGQAARTGYPPASGGSWDPLSPSDIQGGGSMKLCR
jgi:hypothetical protein